MFVCTNVEGNDEQEALIDATQDQYVRYESIASEKRNASK